MKKFWIGLLMLITGAGLLWVKPSSAQTSSNDPALLFLPLISQTIESPVWLGPESGYVVTIAYDRNREDRVYIGTWGAGVYRSDNGGISWQRMSNGLGNLYVQRLVVDPQQAGVVYAGTYGSGVYKTVDGGASWFPVNQGILAGAMVYALAVDPQHSGRIYCGVRAPNNTSQPPWGGVVYRSQDGGTSWSAVLQNIGGSSQQDWVYSLAVDPQHPNLVLAATHEHGPYRSLDYGASWQAAAGVQDGSGRAVVFAPQQDVAYLGVWHRSGVYKTNNGGDSWVLKTNGIQGAKIYDMALNPANPQVVYAATFMMDWSDSIRGMARTTDGGQTWARSGLHNLYLYSVAVNPFNGNEVLAGSVAAGIFRSTDGGQTWIARNQGLVNTVVNDLAAPAGLTAVLYSAVSGRGVLRSTDGGVTWQEMNAALPTLQVNRLVLADDGKSLFALTATDGLYQFDGEITQTWKSVELPVDPSVTMAQPNTPSTLPDSPDFWEAIEPGSSRPQAVVSTNGQPPLYALAFSPSQPQIGYLGSAQGVYITRDGGLQWQPAGLVGQPVRVLSVDWNNPYRIFAATDSPPAVWVSQDGGVTWEAAAPAGWRVAALAALPGSDTLLAATDQGIFRRLPDGSWQPSGLAGQPLTALTVDEINPTRIAAGGSAGVWLSLDGGWNWQRQTSDPIGNGIRMLSFQADGLYVGTDGQGILRLPLR